MKKLICNLLVITFIFTLSLSVYAITPEEAADMNTAMISAYGIMQGTDEGFLPEKNVTRAETAAILTRMYGIPESDIRALNGKKVFSDVKETHWASGYIAKATELGLLKGTGDGTFKPDDNVTLGELYTIATRLLGGEEIANQAYSIDWPFNYYNFCNDNEIDIFISNEYDCFRASTRLEAATIFNNVLQTGIYDKESKDSEDNFNQRETTFGEDVLGKQIIKNVVISNYSYDNKTITWKYNNRSTSDTYDVVPYLDLRKVTKNDYYTFLYDKNFKKVIMIYNAKTYKVIEEDTNPQLPKQNKDENTRLTITPNDLYTMLLNFEMDNYVGTIDQRMCALCDDMMEMEDLSFDATFSTASQRITDNSFYNGSNKAIKLYSLVIVGLDKDGNVTSGWNLQFDQRISRETYKRFTTDMAFPSNTVTYGIQGFDVEILK